MSDYAKFCLDWLEARGMDAPDELLKTVGYFTKVIERLVRELYREDINDGQFVDQMVDLISGQLRRAWYEGIRENGYEPADQRPEWESILQGEIVNEFNYIERFGADIWEARVRDDEDNTPKLRLPGLYARAALWVNRYLEVRSLAVLTTAPKEARLMWMLGRTEEHCDTCLKLSKHVATVSEWEMSGWRPQSRALQCGGWRCDCSLVPTKRLSMGVPKV